MTFYASYFCHSYLPKSNIRLFSGYISKNWYELGGTHFSYERSYTNSSNLFGMVLPCHELYCSWYRWECEKNRGGRCNDELLLKNILCSLFKISIFLFRFKVTIKLSKIVFELFFDTLLVKPNVNLTKIIIYINSVMLFLQIFQTFLF